MKSITKKFILLLTAASVVIVASACQTGKKADIQEAESLDVKTDMASFTVKTLNGADTSFPNLLFQSELTVLHIWEPSCADCIDEMKILGELSREYAGMGVQIAGVISNVTETDDKEVLSAMDNAQAYYVQILDSKELKEQYSINDDPVPLTLYLDRNGNLLGTAQTHKNTLKAWRDEIEEYHQSVCIGDHPADCSVG